jgi:hypothetical protein
MNLKLQNKLAFVSGITVGASFPVDAEVKVIVAADGKGRR